ncbi:hypothetical protein [Streptomyces sp. NPDC000878]
MGASGSLDDEDYDWVARGSVPVFVGRLRHMRESRREAMAMRALRAFAMHRPVDELVQLAHHFDQRDAFMLMATVALSRPVREAAQLALLQCRKEAGGKRAPITPSIVHDVVCQRTAFDVAVFVRVLKAERVDLAEDAVRLFASPGSGRTNLDKALLHIALVDEGCRSEADQLLKLTLRAITDRSPDAVARGEQSEEIADLAGAFQHLSPGGKALENWVKERLRASAPAKVEQTRQLVATLIAQSGADHDALAAYIGGTAHPLHTAKICALLARGKDESPTKLDRVRRHALGRENMKELAKFVSYWHKEPALTRTTRQLLADIVAGVRAGDTVPRSLGDLNLLAGWLGGDYASPACSRALRNLAVERVEGCAAADLTNLLDGVEGSRERGRAAHKAGRRLAVAVMGAGADRGWFVSCLLALHDAKHPIAVRAACRELADPSRERRVDAGLVADVAGRLHGVGLGKVAWDLLERFLENEQLVTPADVVEVVRRVPCLPTEDARLLLRATVGRWSDMGHRDNAVARLRADGQDEAAGWVVNSLR